MRGATASACAALAAMVMTSAGAQVAFEDVTTMAGLDAALSHDKPAGGIGVADYNRDGWPDLFLGHSQREYRLYRNVTQTDNHWLGIRLVGGGAVHRGTRFQRRFRGLTFSHQ